MEQTAWGYITPQTLAYLGETGGLDEVKIIASGPREAIEGTAQRVAGWLQEQGHAVREIQVPPPGQHPHQGQMGAIMLMFNVFSLVALLLSGVLVGNTVAAMMARQIREIGIMKAIGAGTGQIARLYFVMMLLLGVGAWVLAFPPTLFAARALAGTAASNLNLRIASTAIPWWALVVQGVAALLVPVAAATVPVLGASRTTVQRALHEAGTSLEAFGARRFDAWLGRRRYLNPMALLGLRNTFRKRGRLLLTLGLLAAGGAMFMSGLNFSKAWSLRLAEVNTGRKYDATIRFQRPEPIQKALAVARAVPGVTRVEAWGTATAAWSGGGTSIPVVRTYPDKGHGSFQVTGIPPDTSLVDFPIVSGRWFQPGDEDVVVLNHVAASNVPGVKVGDVATIYMDGLPHTWRVVGLIRELGAPATAYIPLPTFTRLSQTPGSAQLLALNTSAPDAPTRKMILQRVEASLQDAGLGIDLSVPVSILRTAMSEHMSVLLGLILGLAGLMTVVGVLGLTATMSISVLERTRELGVMRAIGASPARVVAVILGEGLFVGALSTLLAVGLALPITALINRVVGSLAFRMPLPFVVSPSAFIVWVGLVLFFSSLATLFPALRASRLSVRDALDYV
jgi:putative ABC transport system permease protein